MSYLQPTDQTCLGPALLVGAGKPWEVMVGVRAGNGTDTSPNISTGAVCFPVKHTIISPAP